MSQSVTVLSGVANATIGGLVTVPLDIQASISGPLQTLLTTDSNSVVSGGYYLNNVNAVTSVSGLYTVSANSTTLPGILEFTNTDPNGSVVSGSSNVYVVAPAEPPNYSILIDQVPGTFQIRGNGSQNQLAIFAKGTTGTFNTEGGSGTIIAGGGGDVFATNGNWTVDGSTDGGDTVNANGSSVLISSYGQGSAAGSVNGFTLGEGNSPSNVIGLLGGTATVNASGTADLVEGYSNSTDIVSVLGSAAVLVSGGNVTVDAASGSTNVKAFFQTGGNLYFVNQSTVAALVGGDAPNATGGSATVFGGTGGGYFTGGTGGSNSLIGGFAPGQTGTAAGLVTLTGSGPNNFLEATGSVSGSGGNVFYATNDGGTATIIASASTGNNTIDARGASAAVVTSSGAGAQSFFLITGGYNETIAGSTVSGATNTYYLTASDNNGTEILQNFRLGKDVLTISGGVATIQSAGAIAGGSGTALTLSDGTVVKLIGTTYNASTFNPYIGKSSI